MANSSAWTEPKAAPRAVVLLSGGLDSTTTLAIARDEGYEIHALTFRYGQRHAMEIAAAQRIAAHFGVAGHTIVPIDLRIFGGSALTSDAPVPKDRSVEEMGHGVPITYVPARNTIFLSLAMALAEILQTGLNSPDTALPIYLGLLTGELAPPVRQEVLYSMGLCERQEGYESEAHELWRHYLTSFPRGPHATQVTGLLGAQ